MSQTSTEPATAAPIPRQQASTPCAGDPRSVRTLAIGVALATLALVAAHTLSSQVYQTNDDPGMDLTARGFGRGHPEPHLLFINILVGDLLAALYKRNPAVPWYRLFMLGVQAVSGAVLYAVLLARGPSRSKLLLASLYLVVFDVYFYANPQFTITAAVAAQAAVMLWLESADRGCPLGPARLSLFLGLLACSVMIRDSSCLMVLLLALPAIAVTAVHQLSRPSRPAERPARLLRTLGISVWPFALGAGLVAALFAYNDDQYRSQPQWRQFYRYNELKSVIIDREQIQYTPETKWVFDRVGWSENDLEMFKTFAYFGDDTYGIERVERLVRLYQSAHRQRSSAREAQILDARLLRDVLASARPGAAARTALLFLPLLFLSNRRERLLLVTLSAGSMVLLLIYLVYGMNRCPPRVSDPILAYVAGLAIFAADAGPTSRRMLRVIRGLGTLAAIGLALLYLRDQHSSTANVDRSRADFERVLALLHPYRNRLIVNWNGALPFQLLPPLGSWESLRDLRVLSIGTGTRTPDTRQLMRQFDVRDFFREAYTRNDILIVAPPTVVISCLIRYAEEHYRERVVVRTMRPVYCRTPDGARSVFCIYTLARDDRPRAARSRTEPVDVGR